MEAALCGVSGPAVNVRIAVPPGNLLTVGRTDRSQFSIPADGMLSGLHFSLEMRGEHVILRDLGSTNGTYVNQARVTEQVLKHGDYVQAGQTVFKLELAADSWHPLAVLFAEAKPVYAILDAAREPKVLELLRLSGAQYMCLHQGRVASELELVAPYLAALTPHSELPAKLVEEGWGKSWGVFFTSQQPLDMLWRQLAGALMAYMEGEELPVFFRYFDPRVLREFLPIADAQQLMELGGAIDCYFMEDEEPDGLLRFRMTPGSKLERFRVRTAS